VGCCLSSTGEFAAARLWFERAVTEIEKGDFHGRVDNASLGASLHQVGYCLLSTVEFSAAHRWFERAIAQAEKGDIHGRVDHASIVKSLRAFASCLRRLGQLDQAAIFDGRASKIEENFP
jgi:hypothetical protein